jgi:hypothetical protein
MADEPQDWTKKRTAAAQQLARDFGNFVNPMDQTGRSEFVEFLGHEHRTLQQSCTGMMLLWFKHLSELPSSHYDARNEHAVKVAKMIRATLEEKYGSAWCHMPCI